MLTILFVFALAAASPVAAQDVEQKRAMSGAPRYEYEVASFKTTKAGGIGFAVRLSSGPDNLSAANVPLILLLQQAYGMQPYQISGGPDWLRSDRYDVEAKIDRRTADALKKMTPEERQQTRQRMLQTLLTEKLHLEVRRTTKELPIYTLVVGKNGPKLREADAAEIAAATIPADGPAALPTDASRVTFGPGGATHEFSIPGENETVAER